MTNRRTIVIGDCHGNRKTALEILVSLRLERGRDTVIFLGDVIDRGCDSKGVLDLIMSMQREGLAMMVRGNHEQMLLDAANSGIEEDYLEFINNGGEATLLSFGVPHPSQIPSVYLNFISNTPLFWENATNICVHAGLPCKLVEPISAADRWDMLWTRTTWTDPAFLNGKRLVTGHQIKSLNEIRGSLATDHVFIDNGCYLGAGCKGGTKGNLVALVLETNELYVQPNIDGVPLQELPSKGASK
ncbi:hypothetical protein GEOBRER4_n1616 [Citrifermentans bremense]|uniref:Calcineurin-like phosphoesterase domain-containing protein n=1 Tax=Citrifermentans bremense TaxID=60035 RepID=A0A6S6M590_9BACT|nr:metallophosphoesterase [Citrifermentans bremense]BCG46801.1 hypothetical protein GEOBRER4_n1616 [Citrifermentans bremense]